MLLRLLSLVFIGGLFAGCPPSNEVESTCPNAESFEIIDFSDLDGCSFLLTSPNYDFNLNPINLKDFIDTPEAGQEITIEFELRDDLAGVCMSGRIAEIVCIK